MLPDIKVTHRAQLLCMRQFGYGSTMILGIFGLATIALTCWVKEGFIFILIRVANALAK